MRVRGAGRAPLPARHGSAGYCGSTVRDGRFTSAGAARCRAAPAAVRAAEVPQGQSTLSALSPTTKDVWPLPVSVPVNFRVTVWPMYGATLKVYSE
jgi:hypothetical protein